MAGIDGLEVALVGYGPRSSSVKRPSVVDGGSIFAAGSRAAADEREPTVSSTGAALEPAVVPGSCPNASSPKALYDLPIQPFRAAGHHQCSNALLATEKTSRRSGDHDVAHTHGSCVAAIPSTDSRPPFGAPSDHQCCSVPVPGLIANASKLFGPHAVADSCSTSPPQDSGPQNRLPSQVQWRSDPSGAPAAYTSSLFGARETATGRDMSCPPNDSRPHLAPSHHQCSRVITYSYTRDSARSLTKLCRLNCLARRAAKVASPSLSA